MLRITKGVVVLLSLGGLVCQFATVHSELSTSPKEQQLKSYESNSTTIDTYLGLSKLFKLPDLSDNLGNPIEMVVRPKLGCPHDVSELNCGEALPVPFSTLEEFIANGGYYEEFCDGDFSLSSGDLGDPMDLDYCSDAHSLIRRRYTLTDACGYSKSCLQRFVYKSDNTPPTVDCNVVQEMFIDCNDHDMEEQVRAWIESSKSKLLDASSDNCTGRTVSHNYVDNIQDLLNCDDANGHLVTYYVNDACGQRASCETKVLLRSPRPELNQPHDKSGLSCGDELPAAATNMEEYKAIGGSAEDYCGKGLLLSHKDIGDLENMDYCRDRPIIFRRKYTVTDGCGNTRSTIQRFEFTRDTEAPSISCESMSDFVVDCDKVLLEGEIQEWISSMENKIMKSATDNCGGMTVNHNYLEDSAADMDCAGGAQMPISFTVSDACGNSSQCAAAIVSSSSPTVERPEVICVDDVVNISCGKPLPSIALTLEDFRAAGGEIIKFCDGELSIRSEDIGSESNIDICSASKNIMRRRYIINDECGNETRCLQRITYEQDVTAPAVDCDLTNDLIIDCDIEASSEDINTWLDLVQSDLEVASTDNCGSISITNDYSEGTADDLDCNDNNELVITYVISDACGNATSCSVSIHKEDSGSTGLVIGNKKELSEGSILYQNSPNPFEDRTTIKFELDQASKVRFTIYDLSGKLLFEQSREHNEGLNTINITRDMLNNISGVVFYALETNGFKEVKTMIILE